MCRESATRSSSPRAAHCRARMLVCKISGMMPYLAGTKNAECVPIREHGGDHQKRTDRRGRLHRLAANQVRQDKSEECQARDKDLGDFPEDDGALFAVLVSQNAGERREEKERRNEAGRDDRHDQLRIEARQMDVIVQHIAGVKNRDDVNRLVIERCEKLRQHQPNVGPILQRFCRGKRHTAKRGSAKSQTDERWGQVNEIFSIEASDFVTRSTAARSVSKGEIRADFGWPGMNTVLIKYCEAPEELIANLFNKESRFYAKRSGSSALLRPRPPGATFNERTRTSSR